MKGHVNESSSSSCLKFSTLFTFIVVIASFGTFSILQWKEIIKLNDRITQLELDKLVTVQKRNQGLYRVKEEEFDVTKRGNQYPLIVEEQTIQWPTEKDTLLLHANAVDGENLKHIYKQLLEELSRKQTDLIKNHCSNSTNVCIPGPPGPPGPKGDRGQDGSTSHGPRRYRDVYGGVNDVADSCCARLAKPILHGRTDIVITANRGNDIILPCRPSGLPTAEVHWSPAVDPRQLGRYIQTVDGLMIKSTDYIDTTTFTCHASNVFGNVDKTIHLIVTDPIQVSVSPQSSQLKANQSIDFTCSFSGVPPPVIKWYHVTPLKRMEPVTSGITTSSQQSVLHIDNIGALSAGRYLCQVFNNFDNKSSSANLAVTSKPEIVNGPKTQLVSVGTTVTLHCDVVSNPPATIDWTFPKTGSIPPKTATINPDGSVTLFHVDSFSEGRYTCTATNTVGTTTSSGTLSVNVPLTITATPHEKALTAGETFVQLQCHASGGKVSLTWSKLNSAPLSANPGKFLAVGDGLIVTGVDKDTDNGVYVCNGTDGKQHASDKVIMYKDMGQLTCSSVFSDCGLGVGGACGGTCPGNCATGNIYGYKRYTLTSLVCLAAQHTGGMTNNKAIWTIEHSTNTFEPQLSNAIQSQYSGPVAQEAVFWSMQHSTVATPFG